MHSTHSADILRRSVMFLQNPFYLLSLDLTYSLFYCPTARKSGYVKNRLYLKMVKITFGVRFVGRLFLYNAVNLICYRSHI